MSIFGRAKLGPKTPEAAPVVEPPKPETPPTPQPTFVTQEQLEATVNAAFERIGAMLRPDQPAPVATPVAPSVPDISDEEIDNAILSGPGAAGKIRGMVQRVAQAAVNEVVQTHIVPLQQVGLGALGNLTAQQAESVLPHYKKFKGEIDKRIAHLTPAQRVDIAAIKAVHDMVVGENWETLANEHVEMVTRQRAEEQNGGNRNSSTPSGRVARGSQPAGGGLSFEDAVGPDAMRAIQEKGLTPEEFVNRLGYKSVDAYLATMREAEAQHFNK